MISLSPTSINKLLCVGAHSDDIEIGCGGTILSLMAANPALEVCWVVFSANPARKKEALASARDYLAPVKKKTIQVKAFKESFFPDQWSEIKAAFEGVRKKMEPDLILTHTREDRHQDHRVLSDLAWNTFRNHLVLEYEIMKYDGDLGQPNVFVPVSKAHCRKKVQSLMTHFASQTTKHWFTADTFEALMRIRGVESASPSGFAEAFYGRKLVF